MPSHPVYRAARAVVFATVCVALAITGHMMASRATVPPAAAAGGLAVMITVGVALSGTERSLATILLWLLGGQFMLHALFSAAQHGQHLAHGGAMAPSSTGGGTMALGHVVAAVVSAWWLRRGERAAWALARRIAAAVVRPSRALRTARLPLPPVPCRWVVPARSVPPRSGFLRHVVVRRGPPSPAAALV
ncbi:MAG: hypothetical protein ACRDP6_39735 [Actinoallomurus sp.]